MELKLEEKLLYEYFEILLPSILFTGTEKEREDALQSVKTGGSAFVQACFEEMCEMDQVECPFWKMISR